MGSNPTWGSDFFCVLLWFILYISLYFLYNNISGIGWLVGHSFVVVLFLVLEALSYMTVFIWMILQLPI